MIELLMAGALLSAPMTPPDRTGQARPASQDPGLAQPSVQLEDVVVSGRSLDGLIRDFVGEVGEPNRGRGLARWDRSVCVGVANLRGETAEYIADRVSTVAADIGLEVGRPGCSPNILVVATADGGALARDLVEERRRAFRKGGSGMDRGGAALRDFIATDRPVRWWQMSVPVDSQTGNIAGRIPGECSGNCTQVWDYAPQITVFAASRMRTQIVDDIVRAVVIVDVDDVAHLSVLQLADYIALVSLAQIDPDADTSGYASILNVFDDPDGSPNLTDWDQAYLGGLYAAQRHQSNWRAGRHEIVSSIHREHRALRAAQTGPAAGD